MTNILEWIALGSFGAILQNFQGYQLLIEMLLINRKPFNCTLCMTFWLGLGYFLYWDNSFIDSMILAAPAAIFAELIDRQLQKV